jgi:hypothetical protein
MFYKPRLYFFLLCTLFCAINVKSQPIIGFQGGINLSSLLGHKYYDENKIKVGVSAYLFTDISLGRNSIMSVETGLAISQQGMNHIKLYDSLTYSNELSVKNRLNYIYVPIYLKENMTNFYTKIGPYAGYLISAKSKINLKKTRSFKNIGDTTYYDGSFQQNVNPYDIGISIGAGYIHFFEPGIRRHRGRGRSKLSPILQVDFRYNVGLIKIGASADIPELKLMNQCLTIGLTLTSVRN